MNALLKTLFVATAFTSISASAVVTDITGTEAKFSFEGTIEPMCKTSSGNSNSVTGLKLDSSQQTQDIGTLDVWCNTGENATTEYTSANGGFLVANNAKGSKIAYTLNIGDTTGIDLQTGTYKHSKATAAGTGVSGETQATALKITPQSNGLNDAGTYSDTITVTVSPN
ncbi:hypothetical protein [Pseudoalteromonas luteoviolacea]|uniref:Spore coat protein U domain-containing protein n=3 Tax=Pseudoalteromonas luteoviolacea TaxID=43657 RepID=A0A023Q130_9GAMM|nr:hypothetical protein [Pseudoalteromonas luteoviolacea]AHX39896.1 hypothetical protein [Pseudoalteromonas luteoviolacea]AOT10975.1 hypothetical protein S4054249_24360 [Pseudoalteromonas luteoviolacea]AOT15861.1 hypothetical protein S40542_24150 [Pseudoalteromonas luteoviolacea]AOT20796.1 hypothetical protein S4054_24280 [Pseudoalteromonas luteoviolacea]KID56066.1 hypothetical protein JF50_17355 [Pseudoalteromonas luteoviolacea]